MASNAAFFLAMQGQVLTRTFLAWELTQQEMSLAYINIAFAIPMLLFSLIGGAVSDRIERRKLILIGMTIVTINEFCVLLLLLNNALEFIHLIIAGVVGGIVIPFIMPARTAIVYRLVGPNILGNAMAISSGVVNLSRVIGPALMGFAISLYSTPGAYIIAVALFITSVLCMLGVSQSRQTSKNQSKPRISQDVIQGLKYITQFRPLLVCVLFGLAPMFLAMPFQNLMVVFADQVWQVGERGLGIMMGLSGLGGVIGSVWVAQRGERIDRVNIMTINAMLFGLLLIAFALAENFYLALVLLVIANACASASQTLNNTAAQLLVDDQQRGRMSAFMMMAFGLTPLGVLPLAYLAQLIGVQWSTVTGCLLLLIVISGFYLSSATLRNMDQTVAEKLGRNKRS